MRRHPSSWRDCLSVMASGILLIAFSGPAFADTVRTPLETGYYYTVQKGDTLWDLSRRFADSPWVWPELWSENADAIANPHLIYPGQKIRMTRRMPPPAVPPTAIAAKKEEAPIEHIHFHFSLMNQVGFIRKEPVPPQAVIFDARYRGREMLAHGDIVYLRPSAGAVLAPGQLFTVYRTLPPVQDPGTRATIGVQHLLLGVVKVLETEPGYAVGEVVRSYRRPMAISDKLMPFVPRSTDLRMEPSPAGIDGTLFEVEEPLTYFAEYSIAFINRGREHGIREGQIYSIYRRDENVVGSKGARQTVSIPVDFGELLVLHVEDNNATVLLTDSGKEFRTGTRIRSPLSAR
jgi:hypothetical protein